MNNLVKVITIACTLLLGNQANLQAAPSAATVKANAKAAQAKADTAKKKYQDLVAKASGGTAPKPAATTKPAQTKKPAATPKK